MAKKPKQSTKQSSESTGDSVVRIRAGAPSPAAAKSAEAEVPVVKVKATAVPSKSAPAKQPEVKKRSSFNIFRPIGAYFGGAWYELRQVRWPNRRATWGLTGAVLAYSAFFVVFVLLLDAAFKYLFQLILGK